jgi:hypothetical protein
MYPALTGPAASVQANSTMAISVFGLTFFIMSESLLMTGDGVYCTEVV